MSGCPSTGPVPGIARIRRLVLLAVLVTAFCPRPALAADDETEARALRAEVVETIERIRALFAQVERDLEAARALPESAEQKARVKRLEALDLAQRNALGINPNDLEVHLRFGDEKLDAQDYTMARFAFDGARSRVKARLEKVAAVTAAFAGGKEATLARAAASEAIRRVRAALEEIDRQLQDARRVRESEDQATRIRRLESLRAAQQEALDGLDLDALEARLGVGDGHLAAKRFDEAKQAFEAVRAVAEDRARALDALTSAQEDDLRAEALKGKAAAHEVVQSIRALLAQVDEALEEARAAPASPERDSRIRRLEQRKAAQAKIVGSFATEEYLQLADRQLEQGRLEGARNLYRTVAGLNGHRLRRLEKLTREEDAATDPQEGTTTPLHRAARMADVDEVRRFLTRSPMLEVRDRFGSTPLLVAASRPEGAAVIPLLLEAGADATARTPDGSTPLLVAASRGVVANIEALRSAGADLAAVDQAGRGALHHAAWQARDAAIRHLVGLGLPVEARDAKGLTPLLLLATPGFWVEFEERTEVAAIDALLAAGADISARAPEAKTVLHLAVRSGTEDGLRHWIAVGADPDAVDEQGATPLHTAADVGRKEAVRILIGGEADVTARDARQATPLHRAASSDCAAAVSALVEAGAPLEARQAEGRTPLHRAAHRDAAESARALLELGADVAARDAEGRTPAHEAAWEGAVAVMKLLRDAGAELDTPDAKKNRPLHLVARSRRESSPEILRLLLDAGVALAPGDEDGETPLHVAVRLGRDEIARTLLEASAPLDAVDAAGHTPLHTAAARGELVLVKAIVERGADVNAKTKVGSTPASLARMHKHEEVAVWLEERE